MQLQTTAPINLVPPTNTYRVDLMVDISANVITVMVTQPGHAPKVDQRPVPPAILTALTAHAKLVGEALLGVAAGSTTVLP